MVSPCEPRVSVLTLFTGTASVSATKLVNRAVSSTPAWPKTRLLRELGGELGQRGHLVERVGHHDDDGVRGVLGDVLGDLADDLGVDLEQVHPAHARLARQAGGDHDDVGALDGLVALAVRAGGRADDLGLEALDRARLVEVERQALRLAVDDVGEHDGVEDVVLGQTLCGRGPVETGAYDGDLLAHELSHLPTVSGRTSVPTRPRGAYARSAPRSTHGAAAHDAPLARASTRRAGPPTRPATCRQIARHDQRAARTRSANCTACARSIFAPRDVDAPAAPPRRGPRRAGRSSSAPRPCSRRVRQIARCADRRGSGRRRSGRASRNRRPPQLRRRSGSARAATRNPSRRRSMVSGRSPQSRNWVPVSLQSVSVASKNEHRCSVDCRIAHRVQRRRR